MASKGHNFGELFNSEIEMLTYLEEFPVNLIDKLPELSGHQFSPDRHSLVVFTFEYGRGFSRPGADNFRADRSVSEPNLASKSNFLHPVIYFYKHRLPSSKLSLKLIVFTWMPTIFQSLKIFSSTWLQAYYLQETSAKYIKFHPTSLLSAVYLYKN